MSAETLLEQIKNKEDLIAHLKDELYKHEYELSKMKKDNADNIVIRWKESINWCLEVDSENPSYFIKNPTYVSKCIAMKHGVEITRDIKNKIATNLSQMFNQKLIGRVRYKGATYYGLPKFFKNDLKTIKKEYESQLEKLNQ